MHVIFVSGALRSLARGRADGQANGLAADGARCKARCMMPQGCKSSQRCAGTHCYGAVWLRVIGAQLVSTCMERSLGPSVALDAFRFWHRIYSLGQHVFARVDIRQHELPDFYLGVAPSCAVVPISVGWLGIDG